jgi:hypothetical protein
MYRDASNTVDDIAQMRLWMGGSKLYLARRFIFAASSLYP